MTLATLNKGQVPMTEEKWAENVNCEAAKRHHKYRWKWDIAGHWTNQAVCVHCGQEVTMDRTAENGAPVDEQKGAR